MPDPIPFLDKIADFLISSETGNNLRTLVVLPNRRSQVFLKQALATKAGKDLWLPDMLTIDELMAHLSGLTVIDPLVAHFELFRIHRDIEKEKARSLDDFLSWAPLMLNDFSDIDYYLADAHGLFNELSEVKALEQWNLGERPLTEMQKTYLAFFHSLFGYYERLQMQLLTKKTAYKAMAYRMAAEKMRGGDLETVEWNDFVFVGFNALTEAEKQVVVSLKDHFQLHYFIDADRYYFGSGKTEGHEAGMFLRDITKFLKSGSPQWIGDALLTQEKEIEITAVPRQTGQVKYAGQLLYEWLVEQKVDAKSVAVVLADERMLIPLLGAVPSDREGGQAFRYNVTMGYPLMQSPFYDFIYRWMQLLILRMEDASSRISLPALDGLMQNPLLGMMTHIRLSDFLPLNRFYITSDEIMAAVTDEPLKSLFRQLFYGWGKPGVFLDKLKFFLVQLRNLPVMMEKENRLLQFQLSLMMQVVKLTEGVFEEQKKYLGFQSIQKILLQLMGRKEVSLKGEPLTGIQVMGMLETRNLDFERVIILGANEGILPKTGFQESFIPYDLRHAYRLPLQSTKTAVASYHFFRLLQRTKHAVMIYNSEPDVMGGGEVSRFVLQIENELSKRNPAVRISRKMVNVPMNETGNPAGMSIRKEKDIMQRLHQLAEKGISPSALNTYVRCPLQFYYRYVAEIALPVQPEASVQSNTFGSVIHGVLEQLYKPFKGRRIDAVELKKNLQQHLESLLLQEFQKHYGRNDLKYGRDLLMYNVARKYVERFVMNEVELLAKEPRQLVATEKAMHALLDVNGLPVKIKGFIDRIDKNPDIGEIRIIDYKTGRVEAKDLKLKTWEAVVEDTKFSKALQVLAYAWLYAKEEKSGQMVVPGIIGLRTSHSLFMPVLFPEEASGEDFSGAVESLLVKLVSQIFDEDNAFSQTDDDKICEFCDFKGLCNR
jgi:CRISPR/Cas system-associated exonuclease Cas4 (RecB family)